ncbi:hypothetical protein EO95_17090 [Methanosarcina sp. 1.H.T.1A.1]|uniref:hypothetical protein n=1 Tax=Methanosarcina sp. 1.H.T.1A.1 TaxID=1483602 RepID=UPI000620E4E5|nr:hypothetical protein [Methanosarcina sp. 1.H.T.1A.1]KKH99285.1 hypothetical protein EO95_17090 [Methanosarcina sp. 1.H.T.1A.1]
MTTCQREDYKLLTTNFHAGLEDSQSPEEDIAPEFPQLFTAYGHRHTDSLVEDRVRPQKSF